MAERVFDNVSESYLPGLGLGSWILVRDKEREVSDWWNLIRAKIYFKPLNNV